MNIRNRLQRLERQHWDERIEAIAAWALTLPQAERARLIAEITEKLGLTAGERTYLDGLSDADLDAEIARLEAREREVYTQPSNQPEAP